MLLPWQFVGNMPIALESECIWPIPPAPEPPDGIGPHVHSRPVQVGSRRVDCVVVAIEARPLQ